MDPDDLAAKKGGKASGSMAYGTAEHDALLSIISEVPDSFNASESSPQWEAVFKAMVEQFYLNKSVWSSSASASVGHQNFFSKKWCSHEVVVMFFPLHFAYSAEFGSGKQSALLLLEKSLEHKSKFETDKKNRLDELARKRKLEEEE